MNVIKLESGDIKIDEPLPWALYDDTDCMLYKAGIVFDTQQKISEVINRGVYREKINVNDVKPFDFQADEQVELHDKFDETKSPFDLVNDFADHLGTILENIEDGERNMGKRIIHLSKQIMWLCDRDMEACFAIIHLPANHPKYSLYHPVHVALISSVIAMRMNINNEHRLSMVAASLTANIGMRNFQELLQRQCLGITDKQRERIQQHPRISAKILRKAGIIDEVWLMVVEQHHERIDGKGYPNGLSGDEVSIEASIISIVDVYTAMMSKRADRKQIHVQDTLREFFTDKGGAYSETLTLLLIKELGIYPPGTFVRLANDDVAIVVKRMVGQSNTPIVKSVVDKDGKSYPSPLARDTGNKQFQIMESIFYDGVAKLNYEQIWGYPFKQK